MNEGTNEMATEQLPVKINLDDNCNAGTSEHRNQGDKEKSLDNKILTDNFFDETEADHQPSDSELLDSIQFPFITKKFGRHQLHPFSAPTSVITPDVPIESQEMLINTHQLEEPTMKDKEIETSGKLLQDEGAMPDGDMLNFPIVSSKPGYYEIHPCSTTAIPTVTASAQKPEDTSNSQNKRGTLSRMIRNLKGTNKFSQDDNAASYEYKEKGSKQKDIPQQIEGASHKTSGKLGKMLNKVNNVSKESKTNISKAIHRISDVISNASKHIKKEEQRSDRSNNVNMSAREKCASLSRKVSSLGSHFSKQNILGDDSNEKTSPNDDKPFEGISDANGNPKLSFHEKTASLTRKFSSIGSHFRNRNIPDSGSGEIANNNSNKNENCSSMNKTQKEQSHTLVALGD